MDTLSELKASIREEIENIWINEPKDLRTIRHGFFPSGAGVYDQYFSVLVMVGGEARGLAIHTFSNLVTFADSGQFDLDQLRYMAKEMLRITSGVIGYSFFPQLTCPNAVAQAASWIDFTFPSRVNFCSVSIRSTVFLWIYATCSSSRW